MTPTQEFLRRVELKLQEIRRYLLDFDNTEMARRRLLQLERMVRDEREATPSEC